MRYDRQIVLEYRTGGKLALSTLSGYKVSFLRRIGHRPRIQIGNLCIAQLGARELTNEAIFTVTTAGRCGDQICKRTAHLALIQLMRESRPGKGEQIA